MNRLIYDELWIIFILALFISMAFTPIAIKVAYRIGAIDVPADDRRMHTKPIPRIGGLAIFLAFTATTMLLCTPSRSLVTVWIGGAVLVLLGILDDIFRLPAWPKFIVQLLVAGFAVWNGTIIDHINLGGEYVHLGVVSVPLTILWIAGLTNAINFIDGLDGLSCGISAISSLSLFCVILLTGDLTSALITLVLAAACLGFLPFNTNPARIFMGDTAVTHESSGLFLHAMRYTLLLFGLFNLLGVGLSLRALRHSR